MSTDSSFSQDQTKFRLDDVPLHRSTTPRPTPESPDPELVDQTKNQIRALVQEIADLAQSECAETDFYQGFLTRITRALASVGGVIWLRVDDQAPLQILYHINLKQTPLANDSQAQLQHSLLLERIMLRPEPEIIAPHSGTEDQESGGNPTAFLLIFGPLKVDNQVVGLVEIFQRPGGGPATQRGYLRFLAQMCEIASEFLKTRRLRSFHQQQQLWADIDSFSQDIHQSLDLDQTAFTVANESRRIIGCDRVSLAIKENGRFQIKAVSGLDTFERRSSQIKKLGLLAGAVARGNEPLWFSGNDSELAPQIETQLHAYIDSAHTKFLAVLPLYAKTDTPIARRDPLATLILEQMSETLFSKDQEQRAHLVSQHAERAISNAFEHSTIFMMPVLRQLGKLARPFNGVRLPKTVALLSVLLGVFAAIWIVPYPFSLGSNGELVPETQQDVFAQVDARLIQITAPEDPNVVVPAGSILATMESIDLDVEIETLKGRISQAQEQINRCRYELNRNQQPDADRIRTEDEYYKAETEFKHLQSELKLKEQELEKLTVRSPIDGHVVNWQLRRNLLGRPVKTGQNLMTVVAPDSKWQVALQVPEKRMGHLLRAQQQANSPLEVSFTLASNPGHEFTGTVTKVDRILDVYNDDGNTCRVMVEFDNKQIASELLRSGTRAVAKINCGHRSIGFVLFHELYETAKSTVLFWF